MKSIISINKKFMSISPKELCEIIVSHKSTKGIEISVDYNSLEELKYLNDLVYEIKKHDLILQVHGEINVEKDIQLSFIKKLESYSDYLGYPIVFTLHTIFDNDPDISLKKTAEYISSIINEIDNNKIIVCLENLNDIRGAKRLDKDNIKSIVLNDEKLFFTYDIGHDISNFGEVTNIDGYMFEDIRNVHLHTISNSLNDHMPIYKNDPNWTKIIKALEFLIINKYKYNIVYEYGLELCRGNNIYEKLDDYLNSIDFVSEKYDNL